MLLKIFSDISLWFIVPAALVALSIAYFYYRNQKQVRELSGRLKSLLTGLRAISIFILLILLFGILFESKESRTEKPVFLTLIDNSSSMMNYRDSGEVKNLIDAYRDELGAQFKDRFELKTLYFDGELQDSILDFNGKVTNINLGFDHVYNQYYNRNVGGITLISDGNYNDGVNPVYTAEKISLTPVFSLAVGDTLTKKDQLIRNVASNSITFLGNEFPVDIELEAKKFGGKTVKVSILQGSNTVASKTVTYEDEYISSKSVQFLLSANTIGYNRYTVLLEEVNGEITFINNKEHFYVEVIDTRSKVLLLANAPHPDVSAVKSVFDKNDKLTVESHLITDWDRSLEDVELVILYGLNSSGSKGIVRDLQSKRIPIWYFIDNRTSRSDIETIGLNLKLPVGNRTDEVQANLQSNFQLFELSEDVRKMLIKAPPILVPFGDIDSGGEALVTQKIGSVVKPDPILLFSKSSSGKSAVFIGEGIWKWKLSEYVNKKENKGFNELIQKIGQYLIVRNNKEPLRIILQNRYNEIQDVLINAEFYNSSLELVTEPDISLTLQNEAGERFDYAFSKNSKDYRLNLGKLNAGVYTWRAETEYAGKKYAKSGKFMVESISLEMKSVSANFNTLNQLAVKSNGAFHQLKNYKNLLNDLSKRKDIVNLVYEESSFSDLIDLIWIFIVLILCLGGEWFIRRFYGSY